MSADHAAIVQRPAKVRAKVSNGTKRFAAADGRSAGARLLRDREHALAEPLGGLAALSSAERLRVQTAAALSVRLEQIRSALARGDLVLSDEDLVRLSNGLTRELSALDKLAAAKRKAKPSGGDLAAYLASKAAAEAAA
jgi:threonine aldolase